MRSADRCSAYFLVGLNQYFQYQEGLRFWLPRTLLSGVPLGVSFLDKSNLVIGFSFILRRGKVLGAWRLSRLGEIVWRFSVVSVRDRIYSRFPGARLAGGGDNA